MSWPSTPPENQDPWWTSFQTMWSNLKTYIDTGLSGKSSTSHNHSGTYDPAGTAAAAVSAHHDAASADHDDRYYTEAEVDSALAGKASTGHAHTLDGLSDVTAPSPSSGQVLEWSGSAWVNATPASGVTDHGLLSGLADDDHTQYHTDARGDARYPLRSNNLSDLGSAATARTNLGLGDAATKNTGTAAGTVAAGDDSRFTDSRTPSGSAGGDLSGTYPNPTVASDAVSNAKLANVASGTIKGRSTAGTGDPEDLTGAQATALLDVFTSGAKGLVPASGGGTTNFLRADGTFAAPGGGGGSSAGVLTQGASLPTDSTGAATGDWYADTSVAGGVLYGPKAAVTTHTTTLRERTNNTYVKLTVSAAHGLTSSDVGRPITVSGVGGSGYNGTFLIAEVPSTTTIRYAVASGSSEASTADTGGSVKVAWPSAGQWRDIPAKVAQNARVLGYNSSNGRTPAPGWYASFPDRNSFSTGDAPPAVWTRIGTAGYLVKSSISAWTGSSGTGEAFYGIDTGKGVARLVTCTASARPTAGTGRIGIAVNHLGFSSAAWGLNCYVKSDGKLYVDDFTTNVYTSTNTVAASTPFFISVSTFGAAYRVACTTISGAVYDGVFSSSLAGATWAGVYIKDEATEGITIMDVTG